MMNFLGGISGGLLAWRPEDWVDNGKDLFREGDYKKAIEYYDKAIEMSPSYAKAYNNRGIVYSAIGNKEQAKNDWLKAIELDPLGYPQARSNVAQIYLSTGEYEKTEEHYNKAIIGYEIKQRKNDNYAAHEHASAHDLLGDLYNTLGNYEKALAQYDFAICLNTNDPLFFFDKANSLVSKAIHDHACGRNRNVKYDLDLALECCSSAQKNAKGGIGVYGDKVDRTYVASGVYHVTKKIAELRDAIDTVSDEKLSQMYSSLTKEILKVNEMRKDQEILNSEVNKVKNDMVLLNKKHAALCEIFKEVDVIIKNLEKRQLEQGRDAENVSKTFEQLQITLLSLEKEIKSSEIQFNEKIVIDELVKKVIELERNNDFNLEMLDECKQDLDVLQRKFPENNVVYYINDVIYDNELLNHPDLLQPSVKEFGLCKLLDMSERLSQDFISEVVAQNDSELLLAGLVSINSDAM
jgi:tetratricopeptide (TPR) repeat protein